MYTQLILKKMKALLFTIATTTIILTYASQAYALTWDCNKGTNDFPTITVCNNETDYWVSGNDSGTYDTTLIQQGPYGAHNGSWSSNPGDNAPIGEGQCITYVLNTNNVVTGLANKTAYVYYRYTLKNDNPNGAQTLNNQTRK